MVTALSNLLKTKLNAFPLTIRTLRGEKDFYATLYCEISTKLLVLAIRGSVSLTDIATSAGVADWISTNFLQHLADRPIQYRAARDTADAVKKGAGSGNLRWDLWPRQAKGTGYNRALQRWGAGAVRRRKRKSGCVCIQF